MHSSEGEAARPDWRLTSLGVFMVVASLLPLMSDGWMSGLVVSFRMQYLVLSVVVIAVLVLRALTSDGGWLRRWPALAAFSVVSLVNVIAVFPLYLGSTDTATGSGSFTVGHAQLQGRPVDSEALGQLLNYRSPDLLVLLETPTVATEIDRLLPDGFEVADGPVGTRTVVVARGTRPEVERADLPGMPAASVAVDVTVDGSVVSVLATHTISPVTPGAAGRRDEALLAAGSWARGVSSDALIIGDLNVTRWSGQMQTLLSDARMRDSALGFGFQPTYPAAFGWLGVPIDQSLHTAGLVPVDRRVESPLGSAHATLLVTYVSSQSR